MASDILAEAPKPRSWAELGTTRADLGLAAVPEYPTGSVEAAITLLFSEHFDLPELGATDSFFVLGGDSLQAASLMADIERDLGAVLPVSVLLEAPTPRKLAAMIRPGMRQVPQAGCLIRFRTEGAGPPLYVVHGMDGNTMFARTLATTLGPGRPIHALRAAGLRAGETPIPTVQRIARRYLREIRDVQPSGPYLLLGHCGGSMIAYEMAQQLRAEGDAVLGLVMIDHDTPHQLAPWLTGTAAQAAASRWHAVLRLARMQVRARLSRAAGRDARQALVMLGLKGAIALYRPRPYPNEALLVLSFERRDALLDSRRGFPSLMPKLTVAETGPDHAAVFGRNLRETSEAVGAFLSRVAPLSRVDGGS